MLGCRLSQEAQQRLFPHNAGSRLLFCCIETLLSMQPVYCECPDRYWEFVCGKGDVVEASFDTVSSLCVFDA